MAGGEVQDHDFLQEVFFKWLPDLELIPRWPTVAAQGSPPVKWDPNMSMVYTGNKKNTKTTIIYVK